MISSVEAGPCRIDLDIGGPRSEPDGKELYNVRDYPAILALFCPAVRNPSATLVRS